MKTGQYILMFVAIFAIVAVLAVSGCKKKETYTVTFDANGGTGEMAEQVFIEGEPQTLIANAFTYQGHTFEGWNTMRNGTGTSYDDRQRITVTSDMTLYAQWKKITTFVTVTFDANGGTGEMRPQQYVAGSPQVLRPNAFSKPDYYFHNWNTEADGSGTSYANTQEITVSGNITLYAQWINHPHVDLGLPSGTLWATCNVGATNPEDDGDIFAWGEITPKLPYLWSNYRWCNGTYNTLTKYCIDSRYGNNGFVDSLTTLEQSDDAATANWGAEWRMPTREEFQELLDCCTHTSTEQNDVDGWLFTGPNGNSIFLPYVHVIDDIVQVWQCVYWSSSLYSGLPYDTRDAMGLYHGGDIQNRDRYIGCPIRPVYKPNN